MSRIIVSWQEPWYSPGDLPVDVTLSVIKEHAINMQKNYAKYQGYKYTSDDQAFDDFITTHWATVKEENDESTN